MNSKRGNISMFSVKIKVGHQNMMDSMIKELSSSGRNISLMYESFREDFGREA